MATLDPAVEARIMAALSHEEGDRVPIWDYLDNRGIVNHFAPGETDYGKAMKAVYAGLGIDLCRGFGLSFSEDQNQTAEDAENSNVRVSGQTQWITKYPIQNLDDLRKFQPEPVTDEYCQGEWLEWNRAQAELFAPHTMFVPGFGCGFHFTYWMMGQTLFSYAIYDAPEEIERLIELHSDNFAKVAKATADAKLAPIFFIGDDIAYKGALMFSPDYLRKTFIKCLKKCVEPLKNAGIKVIFHSDGYVMEILDDMIDAGIDGLNPIEPLAGMDIGLLKKRYGKNLVLVGNVDCSQLLPFGSKQEIIEGTKACIRAASPGGGHFIGSSSEIVPLTPLENILTFYEACREYGKYPIRV